MKKLLMKNVVMTVLFIAIFACSLRVQAAEDTIEVSVSGKYIANVSNTETYINAMRRKACENGLPHPETGKKLTPNDYVPIHWSYSLEEIARIRALEASVVFDNKRPDGSGFNTVKALDGTTSSCENLYGSWRESIFDLLDLWKEDKYLINPDYKYIGLGCFVSSDTKNKTTLVAEYSKETSGTLKDLPNTGTKEWKLNLKKDKLSRILLGETSNKEISKISIKENQSKKFSVYADFNIEEFGLPCKIADVSKINWSSANTDIVTVDQNGNVTGKKVGTANVIVVYEGKKVTIPVTVEHNSIIEEGTKATFTKDGRTDASHCSVCGAVIKKHTKVARVSNVKLSATKFVYNAKNKNVVLTVKDSNGKTLKKGTDYNYTFNKKTNGTISGKNTGTYSVNINLCGKYKGEKTITFTIVPRKAVITKMKSGTGFLTIKWKKIIAQVKGYQLECSTSKSFSKSVTKKFTVKSNKTVSKKISKLRKKKKYYIRVRTYNIVKNKTLYGPWSTVKSSTSK